MGMIKWVCFGFMCVFATTCASAPPELASGAGEVTLAKGDPANNYQLIGPVSASDGNGCGYFGHRGTYEGAATALRNRAAQMGGTYVQIISISEPRKQGECFVNAYKITANVFRKVRDEPTPMRISTENDDGMVKKLRDLKKLEEDGIITKEEFEAQKRKILN